jgi:hypothetical protein
VPQQIIDFYTKLSLGGFTRFISFAHSFPTTCATEFGMTADEFISAKEKLCELLKGYIDDHILNPLLPPPKHGYGALKPKK